MLRHLGKGLGADIMDKSLLADQYNRQSEAQEEAERGGRGKGGRRRDVREDRMVGGR